MHVLHTSYLWHSTLHHIILLGLNLSTWRLRHGSAPENMWEKTHKVSAELSKLKSFLSWFIELCGTELHATSPS